MHRNLFVSLGILAAICCQAVRGETRTWTDNTGKHKIEAEFVEVLEGKARLKTAEGKIVSLPLAKLSKEDQLFLKQVMKERRAAAAPADDAPAGVGPRLGGRGRPAPGGREAAPFKKGDRVVREWAGEMQIGTVVGIDPRSGWLEVVMDGADPDDRPTSSPASRFKPFDASVKAALPQEGWSWTPPAMKPAIAADYSTVQRRASQPGGRIAPDRGAPPRPLASASATTLPMSMGFWDKREAVEIVGETATALVLFRGGKEMDSEESRIEVLDLTSGQRRATLSAPAETGAVWPSPSGKQVLTSDGAGSSNESGLLHLWNLGDKELTHVASWRPYGDEANKNNLAWVRWIDDQHVLTKSDEGLFVEWEPAKAKATCEFTCEWSGEPAIGPGGKLIAVATDRGVEVFLVTGDRLGTLPYSGGWTASVAFSPSGEKLAAVSAIGVQVFDLATGESTANFFAGVASRGDWLDDRRLLVDDGLVLDTQTMSALWKYSGGSLRGMGSQRWAVVDPPGGQGASTLVPVTLPHAAALAAASTAVEAMVLKPGDKVSIDVSLVDPAIAEEARTLLLKDLTVAGFKVADGAAAKLTASTRAGEPQELNYRSFGVGELGETISFETRHYDAVLTVDGQEVWKRSNLQRPPGLISLKNGESIQEVVAREMELKAAFLSMRIPANIVSLKAREPRGVSELTASGVR